MLTLTKGLFKKYHFLEGILLLFNNVGKYKGIQVKDEWEHVVCWCHYISLVEYLLGTL